MICQECHDRKQAECQLRLEAYRAIKIAANGLAELLYCQWAGDKLSQDL